MPMKRPPEPVGTLADLVGKLWMHVCCADYSCGYMRRFDPADLADQYGLNYPVARLMRRMVCSRCGLRGARVQVSPSHLVDGSDGPRKP